MTDKHIIDGVDVSKCDYFSFADEYYCGECSSEFGCAICDERPNCCYKQLKRKEQTLIKIKEIAKAATKCLYASKSDDYTDGYRWLGSIILQVIRESYVESNKENN